MSPVFPGPPGVARSREAMRRRRPQWPRRRGGFRKGGRSHPLHLVPCPGRDGLRFGAGGAHRMTMTFTPSLMVQELARHSQRPTSRPGPNVISLATGDPDFPTPEHISQALTDALAAGATHYAPPQGDAELRSALADQVS